MRFFDLRFPLGWLFVVLGALLLAGGFSISPASADGRPLDLNINVIWGVVLLAFGFACLVFATNHARKQRRRNGR